MIKHKKLIEQLRNRDHCKNCPYTEDCDQFEGCLMDLLAADAIEDLSIQITKFEKEPNDKELLAHYVLVKLSDMGIDLDEFIHQLTIKSKLCAYKKFFKKEEEEERLEKWVKDTYKQYATGWTWERSDGNACDVFDDGYIAGASWAAYEVGSILGMKLEEPNEPEE